MDWIKHRFSEPSTWAGLSTFLLGGTFLGEHSAELGPEFWGAVGVVVTSLVAVFKKSPNSKDGK
jgi:hypothetical protein